MPPDDRDDEVGADMPAPSQSETPAVAGARVAGRGRPRRGGTRAGADSPSRAGRNLPAAIGVGVGLGAVIVVSLFVYRPSFAFLVAAAVAYGCYEVWKAVVAGGYRAALTPIVVGGLAMLASAWSRGPNGLVVALLLSVVGVLVWRLAEGAEGYFHDVGVSVLILLYVPTLAGFAILSVHADDGAARILAFVATVVCSDTGGYATGVLFGRHPLAPIVSKGKTWEGFAGSAILCSAAGILFLTLTFHQTWWEGLLFGLAIVVTATLGDLGESMIKRDLGIKDMGSLLPGHGGIMDRLDSLLPCAAVAYLLLSGFAPV
ncbi:MAG: phosphatidate cytidylyltransferase [Pseudonocardiales bacterium]|jgi:phosphatidate cytidylyltransferase|nr:phosphatidate cytidylyltransferase [Pseudonocardiales bacterium]